MRSLRSLAALLLFWARLPQLPISHGAAGMPILGHLWRMCLQVLNGFWKRAEQTRPARGIPGKPPCGGDCRPWATPGLASLGVPCVGCFLDTNQASAWGNRVQQREVPLSLQPHSASRK